MHQTAEERFWSKVNKTEGCWEWTGRVNPNGYGVFHVENERHLSSVRSRNTVLAHRYSFTLVNSDLGDLCVLHHCDNPKCVNPEHLFLGTNTKNIEDKVGKNRQLKGSRNPTAKLTEEIVVLIRERYANGEVNQDVLAEEFGVSQSTISAVVAHRKWRHVLGSSAVKNRVTKGSQRLGAKLTEQIVIIIRKRYSEGKIGKRALAKEYGVSRVVVSLVLSRRTWKHVP